MHAFASTQILFGVWAAVCDSEIRVVFKMEMTLCVCACNQVRKQRILVEHTLKLFGLFSQSFFRSFASTNDSKLKDEDNGDRFVVHPSLRERESA